MADMATPAAALMSTSNAGADPAPSASERPTKPDEEAYKAALEKADKALEQAQKRVADAQVRVNSSIPGKSETAPRQNEIREQLNAIKSKQAASKSQRQQSMDKVKQLDTQMKAKMNDQKTAKASSPFKSTADIDTEIKRLEAMVDSGKLKMVDERKTLADVSALHKQKKGFGALDERQKEIDALKASIADIKKQSSQGELRELEAEYDKLNKERETLRAADQNKRGDINAARDSLKEARDNQSQVWGDRKKLQDQYFQGRNKYREYEREAAKIRDAKRKAEREEYVRNKKQAHLESKMEEASLPAYGDEIRAADSVIHLIDPSSSSSLASSAAAAASGLAATAQRVIDSAGIKGTKLVQKNDDDEDAYMAGTSKKGKKGKKNKGQTNSDALPSSSSTASKDLLGKLWSPGSLDSFSTMRLEPPANAGDIPKVLEQVKTKRQFYLDDRDRKTKENIDNARKEFDEHEAEANKPQSTTKSNGAATKAASKREPAAELKPSTNGDAAISGSKDQVNEATDEVSAALEKSALDDTKKDAKDIDAKAPEDGTVDATVASSIDDEAKTEPQTTINESTESKGIL